MKKEQFIRIEAYVTKEQREWIDKITKARKWSIATLIRDLIDVEMESIK